VLFLCSLFKIFLYCSVLQVDQLPEINHSPKITVNVQVVIPTDLKAEIDSYLESRSNVTYLSELRSKTAGESLGYIAGDSMLGTCLLTTDYDYFLLLFVCSRRHSSQAISTT
jgi:hypothetical protein